MAAHELIVSGYDAAADMWLPDWYQGGLINYGTGYSPHTGTGKKTSSA